MNPSAVDLLTWCCCLWTASLALFNTALLGVFEHLCQHDMLLTLEPAKMISQTCDGCRELLGSRFLGRDPPASRPLYNTQDSVSACWSLAPCACGCHSVRSISWCSWGVGYHAAASTLLPTRGRAFMLAVSPTRLFCQESIPVLNPPAISIAVLSAPPWALCR